MNRMKSVTYVVTMLIIAHVAMNVKEKNVNVHAIVTEKSVIVKDHIFFS